MAGCARETQITTEELEDGVARVVAAAASKTEDALNRIAGANHQAREDQEDQEEEIYWEMRREADRATGNTRKGKGKVPHTSTPAIAPLRVMKWTGQR